MSGHVGNHPAAVDLDWLKAKALRIRRHVLKGQGYAAQGLGIADVLAVVFRELRHDHGNAQWAQRDRWGVPLDPSRIITALARVEGLEWAVCSIAKSNKGDLA